MSYTDGANAQAVIRHEVANSSWPPLDVARRLTDVPPDQRIAVWARVVIGDGELWRAATAVRWHRATGKVCVWVTDARLRVPYVWLDKADVRRRVLPENSRPL